MHLTRAHKNGYTVYIPYSSANIGFFRSAIIKVKAEKEERQKKINKSRYNNIYKDIITEDLPKYLHEKKKRKDRYLIARYRCGNEMKRNQHWRETEDKICRICEIEEESITHMLRKCQATRNEIQDRL